jgi:hypothetical protein
MNIFLKIMRIFLELFGILFLILIIYIFIQTLMNKKAIEIPFYNKLQCGEIYCPSPIVDLPIPSQVGTAYDKKVARYLADLSVRISSAVDESFRAPVTLTHELDLYDFKNNPLFGVLWSNNRTAYISFRGTLEKKEWMQNFAYEQESFTNDQKTKQQHALFFSNSDVKSSPSVHSGFLQVYNNFRNDLIHKIKQLNPLQILIGGHSLGGAIATICGLDLKIMGYNVIVYTFASPRVGDNAFCDLVVKNSLTLYRIVNTSDVAPTFPVSVSPNFKDPENPYIYTHCGEAVYFTSNWKSIANNHIMAVYINWLDKELS